MNRMQRMFNNVSLMQKVRWKRAVKNGDEPYLLYRRKMKTFCGKTIVVGKHRYTRDEHCSNYKVQPLHKFISFDDLPKIDTSTIDNLW